MKHGQLNWFAVVTKSRQEKVALENLQRQGFECFLPMAENPYQRRSKKSEHIIEPLFPRYLFLSAITQSQDLAPVRLTRGVITIVRFGMELAIVPESIISALISMNQTTLSKTRGSGNSGGKCSGQSLRPRQPDRPTVASSLSLTVES